MICCAASYSRKAALWTLQLIAAPSWAKNKDGQRDSEIHSSKKGNQWHFGMKSHIGVDADSGLVHTVCGTASHVADVTEGNALLHGKQTVVFADAGYQGADKRLDANPSVRWQAALSMRSSIKSKSSRRASGSRSSTRFASIKGQFGFVKVRYGSLKKNTLQLKTLFALSNLWMA